MTDAPRAGSPRTTKDAVTSPRPRPPAKRRYRKAPSPREYTFPVVHELARKSALGSSQDW
jgi:hypothetical protein